MLGALIGAGASLIGGMIGKKGSENAAEKNAAAQREFAQKGVQWKVADAKAAGVHPLYALGAQTHSFTPSYAGDTSMPNAMASAGQDIGRAIDATRTAPQKLDAFMRTSQALQLENQSLQNDMLRAQIAETTARSTPSFPAPVDPFVIPGQANSGVKNVALERIASAHGHPFAEAGPVTDVGYTRTYSGDLAPVYSSDAKQRLEDDFGGMVAWNLRNRVIPSLTLGALGPRPPGFAGFYDPITQSWVPWKRERR